MTQLIMKIYFFLIFLLNHQINLLLFIKNVFPQVYNIWNIKAHLVIISPPIVTNMFSTPDRSPNKQKEEKQETRVIYLYLIIMCEYTKREKQIKLINDLCVGWVNEWLYNKITWTYTFITFLHIKNHTSLPKVSQYTYVK